MSDDENSLDLAGLGKLAKAIPPSSWNRMVRTTCDTFSQLVAPITASTAGVGRLIQAKFHGMVDVQKVLAADTLRRAKEKVEKVGRPANGLPRAIVLIRALENASYETDDNLREIWGNLIANEILDHVHPEFPRTLERLSSIDAVTLAEIAESSRKQSIERATRALVHHLAAMGVPFPILVEADMDFSREHLQNLGLIKRRSGNWNLTLTGEEFLKAVADPTFETGAEQDNAN